MSVQSHWQRRAKRARLADTADREAYSQDGEQEDGMTHRRVIKIEKRTQLVYTCDGCGKDDISVVRTCHICDREFCEKCPTIWAEEDGGQSYGDAPHTFCKSCWDAGKKHRETLSESENSRDEADAATILEWHEEARAKLRGEQR